MPGTAGSTLFQFARAIVGDGSAPIDDAAILVRDGVIAEIGSARTIPTPPDAELVDLRAKTVMPTIINAHGHIGYLKGAVAAKENYSRENIIDHLHRLAYYGVSAFQCLGTERDDIEITLRNDQRSGALSDPELPVFFTAGHGLVAPTPGDENGGPFFATDVVREVRSEEEARQTLRQLATKNPDAIKVWVDDRMGTKAKLGPDIYGAIINEAHQLGLRVFAHIFTLEDAKGVVRAGADGIAHMVREPGPDQELLDLLSSRNVIACTSMSIQKGMPEGTAWLDDPSLAETVSPAARAALAAQIEAVPPAALAQMKATYETLEAGLRKYVENGVRVVLSGDTGLYTQFFGFAEHRELEAMVQAGMPALQAIRAATQAPAEVLHLTDRGILAPGKRADLLVLDANPLENIANTRKIADVYFGGRKVDRQALRAGWATQ